jgi:predicted metalloprotease
MRGSAVGALVAGLALAACAVATATTGTGNQNPQMLVTTSLVSSGANPDVAGPGDKVRMSMSVRNTSTIKQYIHIYIVPTVPSVALVPIDVVVLLGAGQQYSLTQQMKIPLSAPKGAGKHDTDEAFDETSSANIHARWNALWDASGAGDYALSVFAENQTDPFNTSGSTATLTVTG